ncbi:MAG TPA: hypothetical protein VMR95_02075 [Candidatus Binatia bacterium]|nr:hypothetical protein [Candidatus Binatia bacterium]
MKGGEQPHGFTIIEVTIFLAVSGVIFISALTLMSGKQDRTEFSTGISQLTSQLQTAISNIANGYYTTANSDFSCSAGVSRPSIAYGSSIVSRGANIGCTYIGEVIQFDPGPQVSSSVNQPYVVYPIVGNQYQSGTTEPVSNISEAKPTPVYDNIVSNEDEMTLPFGITVSYMDFVDSSLATVSCNHIIHSACIDAVGLFTTFNGYTGSGSSATLQSGSQGIEVVPIPPEGSYSLSQLGESITSNVGMIAQIDDLANGNDNIITDDPVTSLSSVSNPDRGVQICFNSGTDNESGLMTIGGSNSPTFVTLQHFSSLGCT